MVSLNAKRFVSGCTLVIVFVFVLPLQTIRAGTEANVLQAYVDEQTVTVITDTLLDADMLTCKISNRDAEITGNGTFSSTDVLIRTTLLIDISTSMPKETRPEVISVLNKMVEDKSAHEEFKIVTFGEEVTVLRDFTADRFDLSSAVSKIEFNNKETKLFDAIYNTVPNLVPTDEKTTYYRTVLFTDGVDDTTTGMTSGELYIKLQSEFYPVDIVAVSKDEVAEDKDLSAIVRRSSGGYFMLSRTTDTDELAQSLKPGDYFWFTATVPGDLLDGITRQVDIGDGRHNISFDLKFPVFTVEIEATPEPDEEPTTAPPTANPVPETPEPVEIGEPEQAEMIFGKYTVAVFVAIGIVLAAVVAIAIIYVTRRRREKQKPQIKNNEKENEPGNRLGDNGGTEIIDDELKLHYAIKLSKIDNPNEIWNLPVDKDLFIGRAKHCVIQLDETSVSREHCKIIARNEGLIIVHLSSTNRTYLNGNNITRHAPLQTGDKLKIGRETLRVDNIQVSERQTDEMFEKFDLKGNETNVIWEVHKRD